MNQIVLFSILSSEEQIKHRKPILRTKGRPHIFIPPLRRRRIYSPDFLLIIILLEETNCEIIIELKEFELSNYSMKKITSSWPSESRLSIIPYKEGPYYTQKEPSKNNWFFVDLRVLQTYNSIQLLHNWVKCEDVFSIKIQLNESSRLLFIEAINWMHFTAVLKKDMTFWVFVCRKVR